MSPKATNKGLLEAIDQKIVEALIAGFTPCYVIIGWEDYIRLKIEMDGQEPVKVQGMTIVVDPVHDCRLDVMPRADMAIDFITSTVKGTENG